ncbi:ATP-binding protein [Eubacteriaceae bacterium ES3]|nr:ATP-binding protein [Eubacteriaceae bacterium ES3]
MIWFYFKERAITVGHKMAMIGLFIIFLTDTMVALFPTLIDEWYWVNVVYIAGISLIAAGGMYFDHNLASQMKKGHEQKVNSWTNGFYFFFYPVLVGLTTGFSLSLLIFLLIFAFYMVSCLYTRQIWVTNRLLDKAKASNEQLRNQVYFTSQLLDAMPNGIFYTNPAGEVIGVNRAIRKYFGADESDIALDYNEQSVNDKWFKPEELKRFQSLKEEALKSGRPVVTQSDYINRKGQEGRLLYSVSTYKQSDDSLGGYLGIFTDITELKEKETALKSALQEAKSATEVKSQFLANMSHEIRTPMNAIIGMAHLVLETDLDENQADFVKKIHSAATALLRIINEILDFSKIESGKLTLERVSFNLKKVVDDAIFMVYEEAKEKNISIKLSRSEEVGDYYQGDPLRLGQILINLLGNAVKFTETGEIIVSIELSKKIDGRQELLFRVTDSGIGINQGKIEKLFKPFNQADNSTTRNYGGSGLGLSISRNLVEMMEGKIWVESIEGEGSSFFFTILLEPSQLNFDLEEFSVYEKYENNCLLGIRILLVEDNPVNRQIAVTFLTKEGAQVDEVENGLEAVEKVRINAQYDLILMDLQMPVMDGFEATQKIRSFNRRIPIIAMTARTMENEREACRQSGMDDHIAKPIEPTHMFRTILNHLKPGIINNVSEMDSSCNELSSQLSVVTEIDWEELMKRLSGDWELALTLLNVFKETHNMMGEELLQATIEEDTKKLKKIIHTAKGVLGNMDVTGLYLQAVQLEQDLVEDNLTENVKDQIKVFESQLNAFYQRVDEVVSELSSKNQSVQNSGNDSIEIIMKKLLEFLQEGDTEALKTFDQNRDLLMMNYEPECIQTAEALIHSYQFDEAISILKQEKK